MPWPTSKGFQDAPPRDPDLRADEADVGQQLVVLRARRCPGRQAGGGGPAGSCAAQGAARAASRAEPAIERRRFVASSGDGPPVRAAGEILAW